MITPRYAKNPTPYFITWTWTPQNINIQLFTVSICKMVSNATWAQNHSDDVSLWAGPGRQVLDKSYYVSRLMAKKQELQIEIDSMGGEIERLQRQGPATLHLEHK